jgi:hypothetical protein
MAQADMLRGSALPGEWLVGIVGVSSSERGGCRRQQPRNDTDVVAIGKEAGAGRHDLLAGTKSCYDLDQPVAVCPGGQAPQRGASILVDYKGCGTGLVKHQGGPRNGKHLRGIKNFSTSEHAGQQAGFWR